MPICDVKLSFSLRDNLISRLLFKYQSLITQNWPTVKKAKTGHSCSCHHYGHYSAPSPLLFRRKDKMDEVVVKSSFSIQGLPCQKRCPFHKSTMTAGLQWKKLKSHFTTKGQKPKGGGTLHCRTVYTGRPNRVLRLSLAGFLLLNSNSGTKKKVWGERVELDKAARENFFFFFFKEWKWQVCT